jgi:hypothetical protein
MTVECVETFMVAACPPKAAHVQLLARLEERSNPVRSSSVSARHILLP